MTDTRNEHLEGLVNCFFASLFSVGVFLLLAALLK